MGPHCRVDMAESARAIVTRELRCMAVEEISIGLFRIDRGGWCEQRKRRAFPDRF